MFGAQTNHRKTWTYKTHHGLDLREAIFFPLYYFECLATGPTPKCHFVLGLPKLRLLQLWKPIAFYAYLRLKWGLKESYNPRQDLFNGMWQATCTQVNWGNSHLLLVMNLIWLPTLLLAITCVLSTQMGHANSF